LHVISDFDLESRLTGKLSLNLLQYLGTASKTARWIAWSATRFNVASDVSGEKESKLKIGVVGSWIRDLLVFESP